MKINNIAPGTCIMVVAAWEDVRNFLREAMIMAGYHCVTAANGMEALDRLAENRIDVVVTDIKMPLLDGLELTTRIKKKHDTDVIVMAGFTDNCTFEEIIARGASDLMLKPVSIAELYMRIKRVLREQALLRERNSVMQKLQESEKRFRELSITDGLTKIFNSRQFFSELRAEIERSGRYGHPLTVIMLDIDNFKKLNDTFGHLEGDRVLVRLAEILQACLRQSCSAYRYGGEEFAAILPVTSEEQGVNAAERVRAALRNEIFVPGSGGSFQVTVSIGVSQHLEDEDVMDFVRRVDANLYKAKAGGKDRVCCTSQAGGLHHSNRGRPPLAEVSHDTKPTNSAV
jgi:diguanylate cyclase (GGDEF)-like protein